MELYFRYVPAGGPIFSNTWSSVAVVQSGKKCELFSRGTFCGAKNYKLQTRSLWTPFKSDGAKAHNGCNFPAIIIIASVAIVTAIQCALMTAHSDALDGCVCRSGCGHNACLWERPYSLIK